MKSVIAILLAALFAGFGMYVYMGGLEKAQPVEEKSSRLETEKDFREKIAAYRRQRQKILNMVSRMEVRKKETLDHLKEKGINSSADVGDDQDVLYAMRNLKEWKTDIEKMRGQVKYYDEAIASMNAMVQEIERRRIDSELGMSDDEYNDLQRIVIDLNDRLEVDSQDPLENEDLRQILDEELKKDAAQNGGGE